MLAFVKYVFGWQLPTIMTVTGVGMFLTELTDTAAAVLVQGAWFSTVLKPPFPFLCIDQYRQDHQNNRDIYSGACT